MRFLAVLTLLAFVTIPSYGASAAPVDHFLVDAAVGGVVRRDLRDIGKAALQYVPLKDAFRLRGSAQVRNPDKKKDYRFQLDMTFRTSGRKLEVVEDRSTFAGDAAEVRDRVQRVVPFIYLVRTLPVPGDLDEPSRTWLARHGYFVLRYARRETFVEATLHQDDQLVGKFRLVPHPGAPNDVDRIEIPAAENVTVLFTRKNAP
jgi:hypothetical protein